MKYIFILFLFLISCSPQFHINRAKKHTTKAISKGAIMTSNDTTFINDTIILTEIVERGDTIFKTVTKIVEKVVYKDSEIRYITKHDKRVEVRTEKKQAKIEFKLNKLREKTNRVEARRESRSYWFVWLFFGVLCGFFLNKYLRK